MINMKPVELWKKYISLNPESEDKSYNIFHFGDSKEAANKLADLVMQGIKTATSSCLYSYRVNNESIPKKDQHSVITDWKGSALCIIKYTKVNIVKYNQISAKMAELEGEGDKTLKYWRSVHEPIFISACNKINKQFNDSIPIVFEEFIVVYKKD
jgi:uncharacterized protein YhfF